MKENKYDDKSFFDKYSQMDRSVKGLAGAGEWHTLKKMLPSFEGKRVLDLGCGFGWHCAYAVEKGAATAVGVDISANMLERARKENGSEKITYLRLPIEDVEFLPSSFDVILSSLAFHYVESFGDICEKVRQMLAPGGTFVFSVEHPVFTAQGTEDWYYGGDGSILHWPVDHYFTEGRRDASFLGEPILKYHRTLTTYVNTLLLTGFKLTGLAEPGPAPGMLDIPGMRDELRRPMMLLVSAEKK